MAEPAYFNRRYRNALVVALVGWLLTAPFLVFAEWIVPTSYQQYVARIQSDNQKRGIVEPTKAPAAPLKAKAGDPLAGATLGPIVPSEDIDPTNSDGSLVSLDDWIGVNLGHPAYYTKLYKLEEPIVWLAVMMSIPLLWYFCLKRIAELVSLFRN